MKKSKLQKEFEKVYEGHSYDTDDIWNFVNKEIAERDAYLDNLDIVIKRMNLQTDKISAKLDNVLKNY